MKKANMYAFFSKFTRFTLISHCKGLPFAKKAGMARRGFSMLEMLLGIAILALVSSIAAESYVNYIKYTQFDSFMKQFLFDVRGARSAAASQKEGTKWGVRVANDTSDSYEIFSTDSTYALGTSTATVFLPAGISWSSPTEGNTRDIIFSKLAGTTTADQIVMVSIAGNTATTTITAQGLIY